MASCWLKRSKIRGRNSGSIPLPWSLTIRSECVLVPARPHFHRRAPRGEFDGIGEQVPHDLLQAAGVRLDAHRLVVEHRPQLDAGAPATDSRTASIAERTTVYGSMVSGTKCTLPKEIPA